MHLYSNSRKRDLKLIERSTTWIERSPSTEMLEGPAVLPYGFATGWAAARVGAPPGVLEQPMNHDTITFQTVAERKRTNWTTHDPGEVLGWYGRSFVRVSSDCSQLRFEPRLSSIFRFAEILSALNYRASWGGAGWQKHEPTAPTIQSGILKQNCSRKVLSRLPAALERLPVLFLLIFQVWLSIFHQLDQDGFWWEYPQIKGRDQIRSSMWTNICIFVHIRILVVFGAQNGFHDKLGMWEHVHLEFYRSW